MGIKNFRTNLTELFPDIVNYKKPYDVKYLCIDANGILHTIINKTTDTIIFKKLLIKKLNKLIKINKPELIAIFIDGQANLAKVNTQIKRRDKYLYNKCSGINPLNLTPGTPFMDFVDEILIEYLNNLEIKHYYSSSKENNEGEIKLFNWLIKQKDNKVVIVGNDSDLIILALSTIPLLNIYIYNEKNYLSLFKLVENLSKLVSLKFNFKYHPIRLDFVLLSFFQGNDYLSKVANFNDLLLAYKKFLKKEKGFLVSKKGNLNLSNIKILLSKIKIKNKEVYQEEDVKEYFNAITWNYNLYKGKLNNRFIPKYNQINLNTIIKYFPKNLNLFNQDINWLNKNAYLLLLMPITGKQYLPENLKHYMDDDSPIKDLFPEPCLKCIEFKEKISKLEKPNDDSSELEIIKFKEITNQLNNEYSQHIKLFHPILELPIERLEELFT